MANREFRARKMLKYAIALYFICMIELEYIFLNTILLTITQCQALPDRIPLDANFALDPNRFQLTWLGEN